MSLKTNLGPPKLTTPATTASILLIIVPVMINLHRYPPFPSSSSFPAMQHESRASRNGQCANVAGGCSVHGWVWVCVRENRIDVLRVGAWY